MTSAVMKPWSVRALTAGERRLADDVFGSQLDPERVRIWAPPVPKPLRRRPFVPGDLLSPGLDLIVWSGAAVDFTAPEVPLFTRSVFVHELTHVWQSQRGVNLLFAKLKAGDRAASYEYVLETGSAWPAFNIEQQAMIVQHEYLGRCGGECPYPAEAYLAVLPFQRPLRA